MPNSVVFFTVKPKIFYFVCLASFVGVGFGLWNNLQSQAWYSAISSATLLLGIVAVFVFHWKKKMSSGYAFGVLIFAVILNFMMGMSGYWRNAELAQLYFFFSFAMCLGLLGLSCFILPSVATMVLSALITCFVVLLGLFIPGHFSRNFIFSFLSMVWGLSLVAFYSRRNLEKIVTDLDFHRRKAEETLKDLQQSQKQVLLHEKIMSMGMVTSGVAHELKNPLNLIHNFTDSSIELLDEFKGTLKAPLTDTRELVNLLDELRTNLRDILYQSERTDYIVHNMLMRSRNETAPFEEIDINLFMEESTAVAWFSFRANHHDKNCEWSVEKTQAPLILPVRRGDLARAFLNLLKNAFQAAVQNKVTPKVRIEISADQDFCVILIRDNGPGIPLDLQDKVFLPFFTTRSPREGLGLGLSTAYDIVTNCHRGKLQLESRTQEPTGTSVKVYLPLIQKEWA